MFGLAIGLQMVGGEGMELYSEQLVELPSELHHKLWFLIRDISIGGAVELPDISHVQVCSSHGRAGGVGWNEVHSLAIQVYYHYDCIVTMGIGELYNEVHGHHAPLFHGHG
ncbi:hypothetical protein J132_08052 [Termitomyces sp. J132]|nr:hypothetical protein J132_08052 [Termitomyces sp. J132]